MRLTPLKTLKKPAQFTFMRQNAAPWHTNNFILSQHTAEDQDDQSVGFILTKKIFKKAVDRNRVKRRLRALLRETLPNHANAGTYVAIAKRPCLETDYATLKKDLQWALKRLSCQKP